MKEYGIIYKIQNKINGKIYIGQTVNFKKRIWEHFNGKYNKSTIKNAINKYGKDSFTIDQLYVAFTKEALDSAEIYFISKFNSLNKGYNSKQGGSFGKHTKETILKLKNRSMGNSSNLGTKWSREQKVKMSRTQGIKYPIICTDLSTGKRTFFLTISECSEYGFCFKKVSKCLSTKAKDGTLLTYKKHAFELFTTDANQSGSTEFKDIVHAQRLGLEPRYLKLLDRGKKLIAVNKYTNEIIYLNSVNDAVDKGFNLKSVRRVLEGGRPFHKDFSFKYLE